MSDIHRRNFLFGTVAAAAGGTALVLSAPKEALRLFQPTLQETIALARPPTPQVVADPLSHMVGHTLYNQRGEPVMLVRNVELSTEADMLDITAFGEPTKTFIKGIHAYDMTVAGSPVFGIRRRR